MPQNRPGFLNTLRVVAASLLLALAPLSLAQQDDLNWVTTWSAAPSSLPPGLLPPEAITDAFNNQTLRLIAHGMDAREAAEKSYYARIKY